MTDVPTGPRFTPPLPPPSAASTDGFDGREVVEELTGRRVNPLSIFSTMLLLVSLAGGASGTFFVYHLLKYPDPDGGHLAVSALARALVAAGLVVTYVVAVLQTTADGKLRSAAGG